MRQLTVRHLGEEHLGKAFTLVQAAAPCISYHSWRRHVLGLTDNAAHDEGGLLGAEDQRGILAGLASYRLQSAATASGTLRVIDFIALDLFRREETLIKGLESEAYRLDCRAVHFALDGGLTADTPAWLGSFLASQGLKNDGPIYCKALPQDA